LGGTAVNCAAFVDGLAPSEFFGHVRGAFTGAERDKLGAFREASGGTLCLEEIGELSPQAQAALLRALHTRRIRPVGGRREFKLNVRIIATTHRDLPGMCEEKRFRQDLYHRLARLIVRVRPLRERTKDLPCLLGVLKGRIAEEHGAALAPLTSEAMAVLESHDWTGNVGELENVLASASLQDGAQGSIQAHHVVRVLQERNGSNGERVPAAGLPTDRPPKGYKEPGRELQFLEDVLQRTAGNLTHAARLVGMHRNGLRHRLRRLRDTVVNDNGA